MVRKDRIRLLFRDHVLSKTKRSTFSSEQSEKQPPSFPHSPPIPSPRIPIEIIFQIVRYCSSTPDTLCKLAVVNHEISELALRLLWRDLPLGLSSKHPFGHTPRLGSSRRYEYSRNLTKVINCDFTNYNYLTRLSFIPPHHHRYSNVTYGYDNLQTVKFHLNTLKGSGGKGGWSERKSTSEDIISKNYAKKIPTNFNKLIWVGIPEPYYKDCWYASWDEGGFRSYSNESRSERCRGGPSKVIFQLNDIYTDSMISFVKETFLRARFPKVEELVIRFVPRKIIVPYTQGPDKSYPSRFSPRQDPIYELLDGLWLGIMKDVNITIDRRTKERILAGQMNHEGTYGTTSTITARPKITEEEFEKIMNDYLESRLTRQAKRLGMKVMIDAGEIVQDHAKIANIKIERKQKLMSMREYVKASRDWEDELDMEDVRAYL
ncbi:hypothetical protein I203_107309 [Kwoniella mangroviensis CBS 8507]|uniref:hypothetical protein n=1 Tax=Kwoniella mangroviensis CBS 8507 TaxID=1296122 RepID=UPI00080D10DA|nr:uncharacterized protein I203_02054 [Kwoniella mangroviensis CBS 8507]OCF68670.1 hypothetical protein I203_02054 [Kwoniella mangroviensis CBS 8507]